jgi:hypothetical protein
MTHPSSASQNWAQQKNTFTAGHLGHTCNQSSSFGETSFAGADAACLGLNQGRLGGPACLAAGASLSLLLSRSRSLALSLSLLLFRSRSRSLALALALSPSLSRARALSRSLARERSLFLSLSLAGKGPGALFDRTYTCSTRPRLQELNSQPQTLGSVGEHTQGVDLQCRNRLRQSGM